MHGKVTYRSRVAYVRVVAVVLVSVLVALAAGAVPGGIVAIVGLAWALMTRRSGIAVTDDGFQVRGLLRTRNLAWSETDAFIVVGLGGQSRSLFTSRADYYPTSRDGPPALTSATIAGRVHVLSLVAVVTSHGQRIRVPGTASTFLDAGFPARAAAELNSVLKSHNPVATAA